MDALQIPISRRDLILRFALGTAASWTAGFWTTERVVAMETPPTHDEITLRLGLDEFPALRQTGGSIRLNVGLDVPVVISRGAADTFYAVNSRCAHQGCIVNRFDSVSNLIRCSCHGSTYHIDGTLAGGPAARDLPAYPANFDSEKRVTVRIPGGSFGARDITILGNNGLSNRIKLTFFPAAFSFYQVMYAASPADPPRVIPFSLTPGGEPDQTIYRNTVFDPDDPTPRVSIYVECPESQGFFSISLVVTEYL